MADERDNKREPTPGELAWQQRRDKSIAAYNERKAAREERRAANTDDPERAAAARRAAEMYRARIPAADNGAPAPAAGGAAAPAGGAPVPGAGGVAAMQALVADVAAMRNEAQNLRVEIQKLTAELNALKNRQTYKIDFTGNEDENEDGYEITSNTCFRFETVDLPGGGKNCYVIANNFYFDGVLKELSDVTVAGSGTVWLWATQAAPSSSAKEPEWQFGIGNTPASQPTGGKLLKWKLYDISNGEVVLDYRGTFLSLDSPHDAAYRKFAKSKTATSGYVEVDATADNAPSVVVRGSDASHQISLAHVNGKRGVTVQEGVSQSAALQTTSSASEVSLAKGGKIVTVKSSGTGNNVTIDSAEATQGEVKLRACSYKSSPSATAETVNVLASKVINILGSLPDQDVVTGINELTYDESTHVLTITLDTYNLQDGTESTVEDTVTIYPPNVDVLTDVLFAWSGNALQATLSKQNLKTGATSTETKTAFTATEKTVVTGVEYANTKFTKTTQTLKVVGTNGNAASSDVFDTTPLSAELSI